MNNGSRSSRNRQSHYDRDTAQAGGRTRRTSRRTVVDAEEELYPHYAQAREVRENNSRKSPDPVKGIYSTNGKRIRVQHDEARIDSFAPADEESANRRAAGFTRKAYRDGEDDYGRPSRQSGSASGANRGSSRSGSSRAGAGSSRSAASSSRYDSDSSRSSRIRSDARQDAPAPRSSSQRTSGYREPSRSRYSGDSAYNTPHSGSIAARQSSYVTRRSAREHADSEFSYRGGSSFRNTIQYEDNINQGYAHPTVQLDAPLSPSNLRTTSRSERKRQEDSQPRISMSAPSRSQSFLSSLPLPLIGAVAGVIVVLAILVFLVTSCMSCGGNDSQPAEETVSATAAFSDKLDGAKETTDDNGIVHGTVNKVDYTLRDKGAAGLVEGKVSFAAVGDQLANDNALEIADGYAGKVGDGEYDFQPYYEDEIKPFLQNYDLKFINQETILHASDDWAAAGYPTFNSPANMVDTIDNTGFNLVSFCSNHIYDHWTDGIEASHKVFDKHPNLLVSGSYESEDDRDTIQLIERNGITFALLAYGYGANGYEDSDLPNDYYLTLFSKKTLKADVKKAKKVADVVIVYMHWGTEYTAKPDSTQEKYAQYLADLDVDLVIGSHAHITQPIKYYEGKNGNQTPVVFGMSDILSGYDKIDTILSGVFTCDFVKGEDEITIENLKWYPCIEWSDGSKTYIRMIQNMTEDECNANKAVADCDDIYNYIVESEEDLDMEAEVILTKPEEGEDGSSSSSSEQQA